MKRLYSLLATFLLFFAIGSCSDDGGGGTTGGSGTTGYAYIVNGQFQPQVGDTYYSYYSSAAGLSGSALRTQLKTIISSPYSQQTYTPGLWNAYSTTDLIQSGPNTGKIWDIYSDTGTGVGAAYYFTYGPVASGGDQDNGTAVSGEGELYNREHTWPQSYFRVGGVDTYPMYSDLYHILPTDKFVNAQRADHPYGYVASGTTYSNGSKLGSRSAQMTTWGCTASTVFEPINAFKGDVARIYFYMVTRYWGTTESSPWSSNFTLNAWGQSLFKDWHDLDPVSPKETARNTAVQAIQQNRNPYVDYPGLVTIIDFTQ